MRRISSKVQHASVSFLTSRKSTWRETHAKIGRGARTTSLRGCPVWRHTTEVLLHPPKRSKQFRTFLNWSETCISLASKESMIRRRKNVRWKKSVQDGRPMVRRKMTRNPTRKNHEEKCTTIWPKTRRERSVRRILKSLYKRLCRRCSISRAR